MRSRHCSITFVLAIGLGGNFPTDLGPVQEQMSPEVAALHRAVFERRDKKTLGDTSLWRELAIRYLDGRGVDQDLIQACALLQRADSAARSALHDQDGIDAAQALLDRHCRTLSPEQNVEVGYVFGCGFIGVKTQILPLQPGAWIELSRLGIAIDRPSGRTEEHSPNDTTCMRQVMLLRTVRMPGAAAQPGEPCFVEMLAWQGKWKPGLANLQRELVWSLFGIGATTLEGRAGEVLLSEPGSLWPRPPLPERFRDGAALTLDPSGAIHWQFPGDPPLRGVVSRD